MITQPNSVAAPVLFVEVKLRVVEPSVPHQQASVVVFNCSQRDNYVVLVLRIIQQRKSVAPPAESPELFVEFKIRVVEPSVPMQIGVVEVNRSHRDNYVVQTKPLILPKETTAAVLLNAATQVPAMLFPSAILTMVPLGW